MIDLKLGEFVRWINPTTGGWETGNVLTWPDELRNQVLFDGVDTIAYDDMGALIQKSFGGLCVVALNALTRVPNRSEYEVEERNSVKSP